MVSLTTLRDAASATGKTFDRIFVDALHDHLTHVGMLSSNEQAHGRASAATQLAATIAKASTRQLGRLHDARPAQAVAPDSSVCRTGWSTPGKATGHPERPACVIAAHVRRPALRSS